MPTTDFIHRDIKYLLCSVEGCQCETEEIINLVIYAQYVIKNISVERFLKTCLAREKVWI